MLPLQQDKQNWIYIKLVSVNIGDLILIDKERNFLHQ